MNSKIESDLNGTPGSSKEEWDKYKKTKRGHYENPKGDWKTLYDSYFTKKDVTKTYENMEKEKILPDKDKDLVFLSPSANIPTQEKIIYKKDKLTRTGKSKFLVGDWVMATLKKKNEQFFKDIEKLPDFYAIEWDADNLPVQENSTDLIWEIKGWTWHVANEKDKEDAKEKFLETIDKYFKILKPSGCLVVDNMPEIDTDFEAYTPSTILKINELDSKYGNIWEELKKKFEIFDLGEGKSCLKIFRKKIINNNQKSMETKFEQEKIKPTTEIRELAPEKFWGGSVSVKNLSDEDFAKKIKEAATELNFTYSGYRTNKGDNEFDYHFSRYPRRAFGPVATIEKHQEALQKLAEKVGGESKEQEQIAEPKFRVLLGLQEGYEEHKKRNIVEKIDNEEINTFEDAKKIIEEQIENLSEFGIELDKYASLDELKTALEQVNFGKDHTLEEVRTELGEDFDLTETKIYSAGSWGNYTEPAVVIEGDKSQIQKVYAIAEKYHQARIAVEDLQEGTSRMVETKYCEDPDKE